MVAPRGTASRQLTIRYQPQDSLIGYDGGVLSGKLSANLGGQFS